MMVSEEELKKRIINLLEKDKEFRYTVAGLIGLKEILDELRTLRMEMAKRFEEHDRKFNEILARLERHDKRFDALERKIDTLGARWGPRTMSQCGLRYSILEKDSYQKS